MRRRARGPAAGSEGTAVTASPPGAGPGVPIPRHAAGTRPARLPRHAAGTGPARFPQRRWGTPDDPARLIAWLATDEAAWVTGQVINTEGGVRRWG